ncbi:IS30 family transposase [Candidatus Nitrospira neomarina]|uniref:IS30 family transposase n=1 Tax=Candidatus Nitrospira neomarina TaxID=3020899 RepID=A0AA96GI12_9BACT|nr:IS30 family transposase [Candidatus Nitrospira neomarina]WNM60545.1 IS30 family transposase [Candidatus Nitrospira neomarina]
MSYTQLTEAQRYPIYALMKAGHRQTKIAAVVGVHKSTISREVQRNRGLRGYRPLQAHQMAVHRRQTKAQCRLTPEHWSLIERLLQEDWSPEQFSLWLADQRVLTISPEWIYQHVLHNKAQDGTLYRNLRCQKTRKKRYGAYDRRGHLRNRVSIEERPGIVENRTRLGDWELDTIIGKGRRQALVSLTERRSRTRGADREGAQ